MKQVGSPLAIELALVEEFVEGILKYLQDVDAVEANLQYGHGDATDTSSDFQCFKILRNLDIALQTVTEIAEIAIVQDPRISLDGLCFQIPGQVVANEAIGHLDINVMLIVQLLLLFVLIKWPHLFLLQRYDLLLAARNALAEEQVLRELLLKIQLIIELVWLLLVCYVRGALAIVIKVVVYLIRNIKAFFFNFLHTGFRFCVLIVIQIVVSKAVQLVFGVGIWCDLAVS